MNDAEDNAVHDLYHAARYAADLLREVAEVGGDIRPEVLSTILEQLEAGLAAVELEFYGFTVDAD